jgi:hypothetical protein
MEMMKIVKWHPFTKKCFVEIRSKIVALGKENHLGNEIITRISKKSLNK